MGIVMDLRTYLAENNLTGAEFGRRVGVSQAAVSKWANGHRVPKRPMMARIQTATGGNVPPGEFYKARDGGAGAL